MSKLCRLILFLWLAGAWAAAVQGDDRASDAVKGFGVVVDDLGDTLRLPAPSRRIVSLAPSNTELLFAMGLGDRLVG
ncbi:MAG TPA: cobalamin-binding protein, partial [Candidatus Latescibacteria bacterium]|nr:cobalamin-binding protein [Candidatus Latescibacterota bacterium]